MESSGESLKLVAIAHRLSNPNWWRSLRLVYVSWLGPGFSAPAKSLERTDSSHEKDNIVMASTASLIRCIYQPPCVLVVANPSIRVIVPLPRPCPSFDISYVPASALVLVQICYASRSSIRKTNLVHLISRESRRVCAVSDVRAQESLKSCTHTKRRKCAILGAFPPRPSSERYIGLEECFFTWGKWQTCMFEIGNA